MSPTTRFPQLTQSGVSAAGANGAEGVWSPALLGSQPITVGWVQRRTKLRTLCKYRLDTSTGARRRRSAGNPPGSGASRHLAFSQSVTSLYFAVQKKRYGGSRTHKVQGSQPCRGFGARSPDRGLGREPQAGFRVAALTGVWGGALTGARRIPAFPGMAIRNKKNRTSSRGPVRDSFYDYLVRRIFSASVISIYLARFSRIR